MEGRLEISLTGSCRCDAVTYELTLNELPRIYCCHCLDCQKWSGSAFAEQAVIPEASIRMTGSVVCAEVTSRQGGKSIQYVCGACHNRIYSVNPARPGIALLRAGTLDDTTELQPRLHMWIKRKQQWVTLPDGVPAFEEAPPIEELRALLSTDR